MGQKNRLTILTEYFYPEESATAQLLTELATGLADRFDVSVLTSRPNYHPGDENAAVPRREQYEGVTIRRVLAARFQKDSLSRRVINWVTYSLAATARLAVIDSDAVLVVSNPPILPIAAWLKKRIHGTPYAYLIHDIYPDMAVELGYLPPESPITRILERLMRTFYRDADRIIVLGESMRKHIASKLGDEFEADNVLVIPNWEDGDFIEPLPKSENDFAHEHGTVEPFTLVYSGNVGRFHELQTAIDAVDRLDDGGYAIKMLIIGEGARKDELIQYVETNGIDSVEFLPFQPYERLPQTLTCGDASLVGIKSEVAGMCVSSKLYSALAAGKPVLAITGENDEVTRVIRGNACGEHVRPSDVDGAVSALRMWMNNPELADEQGANARDCFEARYTLPDALEAYTALFTDILDE